MQDVDSVVITESASRKTFTDTFEEVCPYYMSIGMSYSEFWNGPSELVKVYERMHRYRMEEINQQMWVMGLYITSAISSTVGNMLSSKGSKKIEYVKEPIQLFEKSEEEKRIEAERERQKALASFKRLQFAMQNKFDGET